jgi:hypothetical protein
MRGGLLFGLASVIAAVGLWRVWMIGAKSGEKGRVAKP